MLNILFRAGNLLSRCWLGFFLFWRLRVGSGFLFEERRLISPFSIFIEVPQFFQVTLRLLKLKIPSNSSRTGGDKSHHSSRICIPLFFAIWTGPIILAARIHALLSIDLLPTPFVSISVYLTHLALSQIKMSYFRNTQYGTLYRICASKLIPRTIMFQNENVNFRIRQSITGNRHTVLAYLAKKSVITSLRRDQNFQVWNQVSYKMAGSYLYFNITANKASGTKHTCLNY